jgi:hypothetical protein
VELESGAEDEVLIPESDAFPDLDDTGGDRPELLQEALVLLAQEAEQSRLPEGSSRIVQELINLLRASDLEALRHTYQTLFGRIESPTEEITRSEDIIREHFQAEDV